MNNSYQILPKYYDKIMSSHNYRIWENLIKKIIKRYEIPVNSKILDVCCGTGTISGILIKMGYNITGVDCSSQMLEIARQKNTRANFIQADITNFISKKKFDFAVSFYDSLNYLLTDKELKKAFKNISNSLEIGGYFLFDMNTREHVKAFRKNVQIFEGENYFIIFSSEGHGRFWTIKMEFFIENSDGTFSRFQETHVEKGYDKKNLIPLFKSANFRLEGYWLAKKKYGKNKLVPSRAYYLVQKIK